MIDVTCEICQKKFRVRDDTQNPVPCKLCQSPCDVPELRKRDKMAKKQGTKCPVCGKRLDAGVKFCVACGSSTTDAAAVHVAGWEADRALEKRVFWHRFRTWLLDWWR